ncbi:MAG: metal-dependent transcriptional regulator [Gemmatimonadota bacterium]|nr:MAG: metal-dependent transcriptional regulator [Gemmatimonadota bacterium]
MSPRRSNPLSRSVEDYLKTVYGLTERGEPASTSALAEALDIQPASVTGMIKRLDESGFVEHVPYRGVRLTETGSREALRIIRRHRVLETYLADRLGYAWDDVHHEAERLEHAASDELIDRMAAALEDPSHDPHGAPIPTRAGEIEFTDFTSLADAPEGVTVEIKAVQDEDSERLRYMESLGLRPGVLITVVSRTHLGGPIGVAVEGAEAPDEMIAQDIARRIFVGRSA